MTCSARVQPLHYERSFKDNKAANDGLARAAGDPDGPLPRTRATGPFADAWKPTDEQIGDGLTC